MPFVPGAGYPQSGGNRTRAEASTELAEYIGGENSDSAKNRAARSWDAAVREFNGIAWKFNRLTQDLPLFSSMLDNTAVPTLGRDTGSGTGFTLTSGKTIVYWVEERVKVGTAVTKRNLTTGALVVTLTGDGTNDKPVITRPTTVNADTTHWALFGTRTDGLFPNGREISEVAIATTTIEDTRTGNDPAVPVGDPYFLGEGDLSTDFKSPKAAFLVDSDGHSSWPLEYIPYYEWLQLYNEDRNLVSTSLDVFTVRNPHETGKVLWYPRIQRPASWVALRLIYHRRILLASTNESRLNVPVEVEQAIFDLAVAKHISKVRGFTTEKGVTSAFILAKQSRQTVEAEHRDWPAKWPD